MTICGHLNDGRCHDLACDKQQQGLDLPPGVVEGRPIIDALLPAFAESVAATAGEVVEEVMQSARLLPSGAVYRQKMVVGYERGGPNAGRMVSANFSREASGARL